MQSLRSSRACCTRPARQASVRVHAVAQADVKTITLKSKRVTHEAFAPFGQVTPRSACAPGARARRSPLALLLPPPLRLHPAQLGICMSA